MIAKEQQYFKQLGKVESVSFGSGDHGNMTFWVMLDFGGGGQGFGGYALDDWDESKKRRVGTAAGMDLIMQLLELFKVDSLNQIAGRPVYALYENEHHFNDKIIGLEIPAFDGGKKFLIKDWQNEWFPERKK